MNTKISRRKLIVAAASGTYIGLLARPVLAASSRIHYDFTPPFEGWKIVSGKWAVEDVPGAAREGYAVVQRAVENEFNAIVAPDGPYSDVDVSVRFKPISGRQDASGGIIFRFSEGRYYLVRANALEGNFRFYYYDGGRHEIASATVPTPKLGEWHTMRVVAEGDHIRAWLNDKMLIDCRDARFKSGRVGLWTKADSVTAFDQLFVQPLNS